MSLFVCVCVCVCVSVVVCVGEWVCVRMGTFDEPLSQATLPALPCHSFIYTKAVIFQDVLHGLRVFFSPIS